MTDDGFPRWPPEWIEDRTLADEHELAASGEVHFASALTNDDRVLLSVTWPGGRRWLYVDPVGGEPPRALRIGELAEDVQLRRAIDAIWSQALGVAKKLIDGELDLAAMEAMAREQQEDEPRRRRLWRRGGE